MKTIKAIAISHKHYGKITRKENPAWVESQDDSAPLGACSLGACPVKKQDYQENPTPSAVTILQEVPFETYRNDLLWDLNDLGVSVSDEHEEEIREGYLKGRSSSDTLRYLLKKNPT